MVQINNLVKRFEDRAVLDGISLAVPQGKITVIMGGSGCGKSTLLRNIIGLLQPEEGEIRIDGQNIVGMDENELNTVRRKFGMLFQGAALFNSMSVAENVALPLRERSRIAKLDSIFMLANTEDEGLQLLAQ